MRNFSESWTFDKRLARGMAAVLTLFGVSAGATSACAEGYELHGFGDVSVKNDYVTPRGLVVTSDGATVQVLNGLVLVTPAGVTFNAGTWTDLNPGYGDGNTNTVNEFDFFVGANVNITPKLEAGVSYVQFISGQNAFFDERNIEFTLKYRDGKKGAAFTVNPYAKLFWAFDSKSSTVLLGKEGGTFDVELGAVPAYTTSGVTISMPSWITVGPKSYWGDKDNTLIALGLVPKQKGSNFGVATTGLKVSTPLSFIKGGAGASVYVQGQYYHLINDNLVASKAFLNGGDHNRDHFVIGTGLSFGF
ncbi:hypothetical protein [Novosphingobium colocasiae]|uniref:hypothetical protein n=1 Tax=Novosphingobium colocasiae TaxID=1256513 RepID=UPI0035AE1667